MALSSPSAALLLLSALSVLAIGDAGRPCKTLFISYTASSASVEVSEISAAGERGPSRFFAFYRVIPLRYYGDPSYPPSSVAAAAAAAAAATEPLATSFRLPVGIERPALPGPAVRGEPSWGLGSLRERARDILVVVAGILFGVGCGALTSATMYLAWYLFSNRDEVCGSHGYEYDEDVEDGMESPKKMGYTDLPAAPATPVTPLKEGYDAK